MGSRAQLGRDDFSEGDARRGTNPNIGIGVLAGGLTLALGWTLVGTPDILTLPFFALGD